jgi:peptide/nickel transport system permease protein
MTALLARRLAGLCVTLLVMSILLFVVMDLLPGDPAEIMLGTSASADTLAALQRELGLDQPLPLRYVNWLVGVLQGDLGISYTYSVPVAGLIAERLAVTLPLALLAILISVAIAIPLGVQAARSHKRALDLMIGLFSYLGVAVPAFWLGLLLILVFATGYGWVPAGGFPGWEAGLGPALAALVLPAIALALPQAAVLIRVTRSAVLETLNEDFVRTARAKGLGEAGATWRHALPAAFVPILTVVGLQSTFLVAGAVLVENVFNLPGLGRLAFQALSQRDIVVMQDVVLCFAAMVIVMNFLVDVAYIWLDPRLRMRES